VRDLIVLGMAAIFCTALLAVLKLAGVLCGSWLVVMSPVCLLWAVELLGGGVWLVWFRPSLGDESEERL